MKVYCDLLHRLFMAEDESTQIDLLGRLASFASEGFVVEGLCRVAMGTNSHEVRETVIKILQTNKDAANQCFIRFARRGQPSFRRRGALICLGLMGCTTAKEIVLEGLRARSPAVRLAASLNTGLYHDKDALEAFERFFEQNRLEVCLNFIRDLPEYLRSKGGVAGKPIEQDRFHPALFSSSSQPG
jgi:hypothetical protein